MIGFDGTERAFWTGIAIVFVLGIVTGVGLSLSVLNPSKKAVKEAIERFQNQAVEREYGKIVVENGKRKFKWVEGR